LSAHRGKMNVFVSNCVEEEKRKNEASFFWGGGIKMKKNEYNRSSTIEDLPLLSARARLRRQSVLASKQCPYWSDHGASSGPLLAT
jgi:hypothetical protein